MDEKYSLIDAYKKELQLRRDYLEEKKASSDNYDDKKSVDPYYYENVPSIDRDAYQHEYGVMEDLKEKQEEGPTRKLTNSNPSIKSNRGSSIIIAILFTTVIATAGILTAILMLK